MYLGTAFRVARRPPAPGRGAQPLLLLFNAGTEAQSFRLPAGVWKALLDSAEPRGRARWHGQGEVSVGVAAHSLQLFAAAGAGLAAVYSAPIGGALFALRIVLHTWNIRAVVTAAVTSACTVMSRSRS